MPDTPTPSPPSSDSWTIRVPKPRPLSANAGGWLQGVEVRALYLGLGAMVVSFGLLPWPRPTPTPGPGPGPDPKPPPGPVVPATEFFRLGQQYKGPILSTYADALDAASAQIASGVDVDTALAAVGTSWSAARAKAFDASIGPALERIAPNRDKTKSAELSAAFRDLSKGIRSQ